jgi:outer membrane receptor protein involved in Fe transport
MKKIFIASALLLVGLFNAYAAPSHKTNAIISGQIMDENQHPLSYATVALLKTGDSSMVTGATTDSLGKFEIEAANNGSYMVRASFIGYNDYKSSPITVNGSDLNLGVISLKPTANSLSGVTIEGQRTTIEHYADKTVVNIGSNVAATGQDALDVLRKAPGVSVDNNNNIALNGKQGVLVLLDDKPTYLSNDQLAEMLKNMPSESISKIELMSNPPAQYDAQGVGGVINIITKKSSKSGLNGDYMISGGYGGWDEGGTKRYKTSLTLNDNFGKLNLFGSYYFSHYDGFNDNIITRTINFNGVTTMFHENGFNTWHGNYSEYKAGFDYSITNSQTLSFIFNGFNDPGYGGVNTTTDISASDGTSSSLHSFDNSHNPFSNGTYDLSYTDKIDTMGQKISAHIDYAKYSGNGNDSLTDFFYDANQNQIGSPLILHNIYPGTTEIKSAKVDYVKPIKGGIEFDAGLKSSFVTNDNSIELDTLTSDGWKESVSNTDHFIYTENVNAGYIKLSKQWKKLQLSGGLRAEQTHSDGNSLTTGEDVTRNYIDLFPSAYASYTLNSSNQFTFSFSRRIDRPSYQDLNPFRNYLDPYTYQQGNPFLQPEYVNTFEVGYVLAQKYSVTLGYSHTKNVMIQATVQNDTTQNTYVTNQNLANQNNVYMNFSLPFQPTKWWNISANLSGAYIQFLSPYLGGQLNATSWSFNGNLDNNFTLPKNFLFDISANYQSPNVYGVIYSRSQGGIDLGLSKSILKKKIDIKASVSDILNTEQFYGTIDYLDQHIIIDNHWDSRKAWLTLTYHFRENNSNQREHNTGIEDEENRVKKAN